MHTILSRLILCPIMLCQHCYLLLLYSRKLSREKTSTNFAVLWLFAKISPQNFGAWCPLAWQKQTTRKSFLCKNRIFHQFTKVFFLESFLLYGTLSVMLVWMCCVYACVVCAAMSDMVLLWSWLGRLTQSVTTVSVLFWTNWALQQNHADLACKWNTESIILHPRVLSTNLLYFFD